MDPFDGHVIEGARTSTANAPTTSPATNGVPRGLYVTPTGYPTGGPSIVEVSADRYMVTTGVLGGGEWLVWADNTTSLCVSGTPVTTGVATIPVGHLTVNDPSAPGGTRTDGSNVVVVSDTDGRSIDLLLSVAFRRGGTTSRDTFIPGIDVVWDSVAGSFTILDTVTTRAATNVPTGAPPAVSAARGDTFTVSYRLSSARFWWTRNDDRTRFGWDATTQTWSPLLGGRPVNLGTLTTTGSYTLSPNHGVPVGSYLPGTTTGTTPAVLRVGATPGESSYPVVFRSSGDFNGVLVVEEGLATPAYNFATTTPHLAGVLAPSGKLVWNPEFISAHGGAPVWYVPTTFDNTLGGVVGDYAAVGPHFLAPVPGPDETPVLRIGNRYPLTVLPVVNETDLAGLTVPHGSVGVALTTGRLKFNANDVERARPGTRDVPNDLFDPLYLGATIQYMGVTMTPFPQPTLASVALVDSTGATVPYTGAPLYLPDSQALPGLGVSGVDTTQDFTGSTPNPAIAPGPRPGASGMIRTLSTDLGDTLFFANGRTAVRVVTVPFESDLPSDPYSIPAGTVYVALEKHSPASGSRVMWGSDLSDAFSGSLVNFAQARFTPAQYQRLGVVSLRRDTFTLRGTETLNLRVGATTVTWSASVLGAGTFTAAVVAANLNTTLAATPATCVVVGGRLVLRTTTGNPLSVGFGVGGVKDLSGSEALGLVPGTFFGTATDHGPLDPNWAPQTGLCFGLYRSSANPDGTGTAPDFRATYRVTDVTLGTVAGVPSQSLSVVPREDVAGYGPGVFFGLAPSGVPVTPLEPFGGVAYDFPHRRFVWLSTVNVATTVTLPVTSVDLGVPSVVPTTFYAALGGYLKVATTGGPYRYFDLGSTFLLNGPTATLVNPVGSVFLTGTNGSLSGSTFTDTSVSLATVAAGDILVVGADNYRVTIATTGVLTVTPPATVSGTQLGWSIRRGVAPGDVDPSKVADVVYKDFDPLPVEPFGIRVLTAVGAAGDTLDTVPLADIPNHDFYAQFGATPGSDIPLVVVGNTTLGVVSTTLVVPTTDPRFTVGAFNLGVGGRTFVQGVDLLPVTTFSPDPGDNVEYLTTGPGRGQLKFGTAVVATLAGAVVTFVPTLLPSPAITPGSGFLDPNTGAVGLSESDLSSHDGETVYIVRELNVPADVTVNPILGTFNLTQPMRTGGVVETTYTRAVPNTGERVLVDGEPVVVTEFLPVFVRREVATRVTSQVYRFNEMGRTVDPTVTPQVYAGERLTSYGVPAGSVVDFDNSTISFTNPVGETTRVVISYAVLESRGGEVAYKVSEPPVWRPPFNIPKGVSQLLFAGDRRSDLFAGALLRVGSFLTYVKTATYDTTTGDTTVVVYPAPPTGVGTTAPGDTGLSLVTDRAVTPTVDGVTVPGVDTGFLPTLATAYGLPATPRFGPVSPGQMSVTFEGDLSKYAVPGHVLEFDGRPFVIVKGTLSDGGRYTVVTVGSPFPTNVTWSVGLPDTKVRISVRPIYPQGATVLVGAGPFVNSEPYDVVDYAPGVPGRTLRAGVDYTADTTSGSLTFVSGLPTHHTLAFYRTDVVTLEPGWSQGTKVNPRVEASFGAVSTPDTTNGRLGQTLRGTYTYDSPDSFYTRVVALDTYAAGVVSDTLTVDTVSRGPMGQPAVTPLPRWKGGRVGSRAKGRDLRNVDRVYRTYLSYFNGVVSDFEQIVETTGGDPIGDRDGKFRFWLGRSGQWVAPGATDPVTGDLVPRYVWFDVWSGARGAATPIPLLATDPVISPLGATTDGNGRPVGDFQDPSGFATLVAAQRPLIHNDLDDLVLVGRERTNTTLAGFIYFKTTGYGDYRPLSTPSVFSRVFPEQTWTFTTTYPGLDSNGADPGVYTAGRLSVNLFAPDGPSVGFQSTTGTPIGKLENPTLGVVTNVLGVTARDRLGRGRVWGYSPTGYPGLDAATTGRPTVVATLLPLGRFPIGTNGLPDTTLLASQSGGPVPTGLPDLTTGDPTLHVPPMKSGDMVVCGKPNGTLVALGYSGTLVTVGDTVRYAGVFVDTVYKGCAVTFRSLDDAGAPVPITDPTTLLALSGNTSGTPVSFAQGDSLVVVPNVGVVTPLADPPTTADLQAATAALPFYRTGTDLNFAARTGDLLDATLPSFLDPTLFGLKELTGQRPPPPMSTLEALTYFQSGRVDPLFIPALTGGTTLDNGDYSLPYTRLEPTEVSALTGALRPPVEILYGDTVSPPPTAPATVAAYEVEARWPDEIRAVDGAVNNTDATFPAALTTTANLHPASSVYPTPGHAGVGNLRPYDLLLVQDGTGIGAPLGSTGVIHVANVTHGATSVVEPPRFHTATNAATAFGVTLDNVQTWVSAGHTSGVVVREEVLSPGVIQTTFTFSSIPTTDLVLDNGTGGGSQPVPVGGYNDFMSLCQPGTKVKIKVIRSDTGNFDTGATVVLTNTVVGTTVLDSTFVASGDNDGSTVVVISGGLVFQPQVAVVVTTAPFFDFTHFNPTNPSPGVTVTSGFHDVALTALGVGSTTCGVSADRLTFTFPVDARTAPPRGTTTPGGDPMACTLSVTTNTVALWDPDGGVYVLVPTDINANTKTNGGVPFTFRPRSGVTPSHYGVGTFQGGVGSLKVMAWEGWGNVAIDTTELTFAAVPTARQTATEPIYNGQVICDEVFNPAAATDVRVNRFTPTTTIAGNLTNVLPGDLLVVPSRLNNPVSPNPTGVGKAGTYLVRDTVIATVGEERRVTLDTVVGDPNGWLGFAFPTVVSLVQSATLDLTATHNPTLPTTKTFGGTPVSATHGFGPTGRVFVVAHEDRLGSTDSAVYAGAVVSAAYASLAGSGSNTFVDLSDFRDALGNAITKAAFVAATATGRKVSGMTLAPVAPTGNGVPANLSGYTNDTASAGNRAFFGFRSVTATRGSHTVTHTATTAGNLTFSGTHLAVYSKVRQTATSFLPLDAPVYEQIPGAVDFGDFPWDTIHTTGAFVPAGTRCFLPGDAWSVAYAAQAAIYVEPSFPRCGNNLSAFRVNVVDALHTLTANEVGAPPLSGYLTNPSLVPSGGSLQEFAQVEVKRPRRWHGVNTLVGDSLHDLRYVYEIRQGTVDTVTTGGGACVLLANPVGGMATQLGNFNDPKVNVHPGDVVRFYLSGGVEEALVTVVRGALSLGLNRQGLSVPHGTRFEVYLKTAPVPLGQSYAELLDLATDTVVLDRVANYTTQSGGKVTYVPDADPQVAYNQSINTLRDTDAGVTFGNVRVGDLVLVDPAGTVGGPTGVATPPQHGNGPHGDLGVVTRGGDYVVGGPLRVDDNRGYYWVTETHHDRVVVGVTGNVLAGNTSTGDRIFGTATGYAVYPTVHGSNLSGTANGREGQMDLRPTAFAGPGNSYLGTWLSVAPFSYRVIRPRSSLSRNAVELIVSGRERLLTWVEILGTATNGSHSGSYFVFQRDHQIASVGLPNDPMAGTGVFGNPLLNTVVGRVLVAPFSNTDTCLSILDRRFWAGDRGLDTLHPPFGSTTPYSDFAHGVGRPVLPDRIALVLNQTDHLRDTRNSWLTLRANRATGTLETLRRYGQETSTGTDTELTLQWARKSTTL